MGKHMSEEKATTHFADGQVEGLLQSQLRRISQLEQENAALSEVNDILRKAVAYYARVCAQSFERDTARLRD